MEFARAYAQGSKCIKLGDIEQPLLSTIRKYLKSHSITKEGVEKAITATTNYI